jgi:predicted AAA+ superfamily ATPase
MKKDVFKQLILDCVHKTYSHVVNRFTPLKIYENKANCLIGVRRCGKTSLMQNTITILRKKYGNEKAVYINLEDDRLYPLVLSDLSDFIESYYELFPNNRNHKVYFFIDEIQLVEGWEKFVRRLLDTENCNLILSGSSAKLLSKEIHTSLRGRSISREVYPLVFVEYLQFLKIDYKTRSTKNISFIKHALNDYLFKGGFPELVSFEESEARKFIQEYKDLIIFRDLIERYNIREVAPLRYLINYLFKNRSTLVSINRLFNDLKSQGVKISKSTLYDYMAYLNDCYAIQSVPMFSKSIKEQNRNPQKIYAIDNGFGLTVNINKEYGKNFENIVFLHLKHKYECEVFYYKGNQEVDFYLPDKKLLVNVSYDISNSQTYEREIKGLQEAMTDLKLSQAFLIADNKKETLVLKKQTIFVVPLWEWLLDNAN